MLSKVFIIFQAQFTAFDYSSFITMESKIKLFQKQLLILIFQTHAPCKILCQANRYNSCSKTTIGKNKPTLNKISPEVQDEGEEQQQTKRMQRVQRMGTDGKECSWVHLLVPPNLFYEHLISKVIWISSLFKCEIRLLLHLTCHTLKSLINK